MPKAKHDWRKLDPLIDNLKAQGWNDTQIAKDLRIGRQTLVDHLRSREPVQTIGTGAEQSADTSVDELLSEPDGQPIPLPTPVQTAVQKVDTGQVHEAVQLPVQRFEQLEGEVQALAQAVRSIMERLNHTPVQTPVQITATPPYPKGKAVRWNLWILDAIQDELKTLAAERDISPSQLVQELLWKVLRQP